MKKHNLWMIASFIMVFSVMLAACQPATPAPAEPTTAPVEATAEATTAPEQPAEAGCTDAIGCVEIAAGDPIKIAYMLTVSGGTAFLGEDSRGGVEIAIADRGSELLGHPVELSGEDSLCSAEGGQAAGQKLATDTELLGIIGSSCSSEAFAALPIISEAGLVMISPSNTNPNLTNDNADTGGQWKPGYYRTAHNDKFQGAVAAKYVFEELGITKVATVHDGSPYAEALQQVFADTITELGGEVVFQGAVNVGDTDMRPILTEIAAAGPELIYYPIFEPEAPLLTAQTAEVAGLENVILMGADAAYSDSFPEAAGSRAVGMYFSGPYVAAGDAYNEFLAKWDAQLGGTPPSGFHAHAYDAANLLLNAIEKVAVDDGSGNLSVGRQALRDALNSVADYQGLTGKLTCSATGDCATGDALGIFQIRQEEVDGNWPPPVIFSPATGKVDAPAAGGGNPLKIGLIMVGPKEDHGWNQAHYEAVEYATKKLGVEFVWFDKLNPADNPDVTLEQVVDDFAAQGVNMVIANSAEMADATNNAALAHPEIYFVHASGDKVLSGDAPANVSNVMGRMEYGKMMAGCAAAMTSETGKIGYLGPLVDSETRRLTNSAYLGAKYCWETVRGKDVADLSFEVVWIGFWFNIPGVTLDPTQVVNDFYNGGVDVVISGIDTTEAVVVAGQRNAAGENVYAIPYDYVAGCSEAEAVCLGVPYFNWGPEYVRLGKQVQDGNWAQEWTWVAPDWADINNPDTSIVGWMHGEALSDEGVAAVDALITGLGDGSVNLYTGPLNYQDGTVFVADGATATDNEIWYTEQLLEGMKGASK